MWFLITASGRLRRRGGQLLCAVGGVVGNDMLYKSGIRRGKKGGPVSASLGIKQGKHVGNRCAAPASRYRRPFIIGAAAASA